MQPPELSRTSLITATTPIAFLSTVGELLYARALFTVSTPLRALERRDESRRLKPRRSLGILRPAPPRFSLVDARARALPEIKGKTKKIFNQADTLGISLPKRRCVAPRLRLNSKRKGNAIIRNPRAHLRARPPLVCVPRLNLIRTDLFSRSLSFSLTRNFISSTTYERGVGNTYYVQHHFNYVK